MKIKGKKIKKFPSAELILNACILEYQKEEQRTANIDSKTNIFVTLSTAVYIFLIPLCNLKDVFKIENTLLNSVLSTILLLLVVSAFVSLLTATLLFIYVVSSRKYKTIDISPLLRQAERDKDATTIVLSRLYDNVVSFNRSLNEKRMKYFKAGVISIGICVVLTAITYIIKVNFIAIQGGVM